MIELTSDDIDAVCNLVDDLCGIYWDHSKAYLIEARLQSLVEQHGCEGYGDLVRKIRAASIPGIQEQVVNAVTTNETLWFRDDSPFQAMQFKLVPELIDEKATTAFPRRFRIWSAACSTGQEVYSIAITLAQTIPEIHNWDVQIFGTDISPAAVEQASRGCYNKLEISRGMPDECLGKYFVKQGETWKVSDEIRSMCVFEQRNLLQPFNHLGGFDFIFCRNVAIYFSDEDRRSLFDRLADVLTPGGWLFAGSSESLTSLGPQWQAQQHCRANCYRPNMAALNYC